MQCVRTNLKKESMAKVKNDPGTKKNHCFNP